MGETLVTTLSMDNHQPSTLLSMDSSASSTHDELNLEMNRQVGFVLTRPPDINLPLNHCDILDVSLGTHLYGTDCFLTVPKPGNRKTAKRVDSVWGAWFFFSFYFKPVLNEKSKAKITCDGNGISGFEKSDLQLDIFMVQHDMENMYMWAFKERPENALGKMQLRSYMNGHSRQGERPFPFSADRGFVRSHRMQRKHYRGLSNPQCVHGLEVVTAPRLSGLDEGDRKRWMELTGRDLNFCIPPEASDYATWRNLQSGEFEPEKMKANPNPNPQVKKPINGPILNLSAQLTSHSNGDVIDPSPDGNKRKRDHLFKPNDHDDDSCTVVSPQDRIFPHLETRAVEPHWLNGFSGVLKNVYGPVTAAKTIYEDEQGYIIFVSLPFVDLQTVKVTWRNTLTHGIIKLSGTSTSCTPVIKRQNRTFKLADASPEHCPPGEFVREIPLQTRIPEDANIEAYYDGAGTVLEILVPKLRQGPEEHEVRVCVRPTCHGVNDLLFD